MTRLLAENVPSWIGAITPPMGSGSWEVGLENFINRGFKLIFLGFAAYALINFVMAAYDYINDGGENKKIETAKKRLTQTVIGLVLLSLFFIFAGIVGQVFFGNWDYVLNLTDTIKGIITPTP